MIRNLPVIALVLGVAIILVLLGFHPLSEDTTRKLPLLTALLMVEFGFLVNAAAVIFTIKQRADGGTTTLGWLILVLNVLLAGFLLISGINLWPGITGGD